MPDINTDNTAQPNPAESAKDLVDYLNDVVWNQSNALGADPDAFRPPFEYRYDGLSEAIVFLGGEAVWDDNEDNWHDDGAEEACRKVVERTRTIIEALTRCPLFAPIPDGADLMQGNVVIQRPNV